MDVICINRYYSWYSDTGHTELIAFQMINEVTAWHQKHSKPVIVTEYGAGSLAGLHAVCSISFLSHFVSLEFLCEILETYLIVFFGDFDKKKIAAGSLIEIT